MSYELCDDQENGRGKRSRRESIAVCQRLYPSLQGDALTVWPGNFQYGQAYTLETEQEILQALAPDYIRGLSLLGGEPMEPQNRATVLSLVKKVREIYPRKTIWCYTGYDFDKDLLAWMEAGDPVITKLLPLLDVIVDGEYKEECRNLRLPFRGSENQRILDVPLSLKEKCGIILHT